ncbi:flavodoxin domain-containing protein [Paenibacillus sp. FSL L8-0470]|uniref:flavodoxin domain-containing protein n=1 Tax=unclassified Paenibacillus TaxID=185978 RepID=UPI0030F7B552
MKTLILYATKYGCTEKAAYLLKSQLQGEVEAINLKYVKVPPLTAYDNIILGGSVYYGKIRKEMAQFSRENKEMLKSKRLGLFICAGLKGEQAEQELRLAFPEELYSKALVKEVFGDEIYTDKMSATDKLILRIAKGKEKGNTGLALDRITSFAQAMN